MRERFALVIDDDHDISQVLTFILESAGFTVEVVDDGIWATELDKHYDVIVLDLKMPVFDGERLVDYWLLTDPTVLRRVIVLSAYSGYTRGREIPAFAVMAKPFETTVLLDTIEACANQVMFAT